jgi:hypothetical protein
MEGRLPDNTESRLRILDGPHLSDDALEAYSLHRISSEDELAAVEEHLLVCPHCETRLTKLDQFHEAIKTAAPKVQAESKAPLIRGHIVWIIAAGLAAIFFLPPALRQLQSPAEIELHAVRNETTATAPSGRPLRLKLDLVGLPAEAYSWELVTLDGTLVSSGKASAEPIAVGPIELGRYYIRIKKANQPDPVREFSLLVR